MALGYNLYKTQCDQKVIHTDYFWDKMLYLIYLSHLSPWPHQSDEYIYLWTHLIDPNQSISLITLLVFYGVICWYFWVDNSYTIQVLNRWDMFYIIGSCSFDEVNVCKLVVEYHLPYQSLSFFRLSFKTILSHYWAAAESKPSLRKWEGSKFEV